MSIDDKLLRYLRIPRTYQEIKSLEGISEAAANKWRKENKDRVRVVNLPSTWYLLGWQKRGDLTNEQMLNYLRLSVSNQYQTSPDATPRELIRYFTRIAQFCNDQIVKLATLDADNDRGLDE
jgi:hypothetical protein